MFFKGPCFPQDSIYTISRPILASAVVESGALQRFHIFKVLLIIESQPQSVLMRNMPLKWNPYCTKALSGPIRKCSDHGQNRFHFHLQCIHSYFPSAMKVASKLPRKVPVCFLSSGFSLLFVLVKV